MRWIYNIVIFLYYSLIRVFALFDKKAALWVRGRKSQDVPRLSGQKVIWMHCSSLGEYEQGKPLFDALRQRRPDYKYVVSFFSPSGYEKMKDKNIADYILYLPLDLPFRAKKFIDDINPHLSIFVKYDIWYNYLRILNERRSNVIFISVLFDKNHRIFKPYSRFLLEQLKKTTFIFTQDDMTLKLLAKRGFVNVLKAGDTRIDRVLAIAKSSFEDKKIEEFCRGDKKVLICGSTWQKDIEKLSKIKDFLLEHYKIIIAPHEISKRQLEFIQKKFASVPLAFYSKGGDDLSGARILIIDTIGILSKIYRYGDVAYIGGGFGHGIHNTLEPAAYRLPVIFGPEYKKFNEAKILVEKGAFFSFKKVSELKQIFISLNFDKNYRRAQQEIEMFLKENQGASEKIVSALEKKRILI